MALTSVAPHDSSAASALPPRADHACLLPQMLRSMIPCAVPTQVLEFLR